MINITGNVNDKLRKREVKNSVKIKKKLNWKPYNNELINLVCSRKKKVFHMYFRLEKPMKTVLRKHWLLCPYHPRQRCAEEICAAKTLVSLGDVSLECEVSLSSHSRECETVFEDGKWHLYVINALVLQAWLLWLFIGSIHFLQDWKY